MGITMDEVGCSPVPVPFTDASRWPIQHLDLSFLPGNRMPNIAIELFNLTHEALVVACAAKGKEGHKVRHVRASFFAYRKTAMGLIVLVPSITFEGTPFLPPYSPN